MRLTGFLITLILATIATCTPIDPLVPRAFEGNVRHLTTGVATRSGRGLPYIRREIRDLKDHHPESWSLYILGLLAFQQMDQEDPLSYYRIAGIHGKPWVAWGDANGVENPGGHGYCPHNNIMFGTWHRPYIALFEQEVYKKVRSIADQATTDPRRWSMAADAFRVPYWDWTLGADGGDFPDFFTTPLITVEGPTGQQTISNPLYQYNFHPVRPQDFAGDWGRMNSTVRCPESHRPNVQSRNDIVRHNFVAYRRSWHDELAHHFSKPSNYNGFARALESTHGSAHFAIGCETPTGHMWLFEYSAFDPLFWLVHANIDRLIAMYQAIHPDTWLDPASSGAKGNFWIPNDVIIDADMPMQPFWKDDHSFYASNDVRNMTVFGYGYPETQHWNYASMEEWRSAVNASISSMYSTSARSILTPRSQHSESSLAHLMEAATFTDWNVKLKASSLDMPPIFRVQFSLTFPFSSDPSTEVGMWLQQMPESHAANHAWKTRRIEQKAKPATTLEQNLQGIVSLTSSLLDQIKAGDLKSLDANDVVPYLKAHLTWAMLGNNNTHVRDEKSNSLTINIFSTEVRIPDDPEQALEYSSETTLHPEITQNK